MSIHRCSLRTRPLIGTVAIAALALVFTTSCSVEESLAPPYCTGGSSLIAAQSVPTARLLPCFGGLPEGWSFSAVMIDQSGTMVRLDSDRAGDDAATFRFEGSCDVRGAVSVPSAFEDVEHYEAIDQLQPRFRARSYLRFDGGCVTWFFDFDQGASTTESVAIGDALVFFTRKEINDGLRQTFLDEDL
ncbi:MAG: hypothetical protein GY713_16610 [Actinomycetia bacterium]|nr:hypothetical protein [Actinomycetes bacterium]